MSFLPTLAYEFNLGYHTQRENTLWEKCEQKFLPYRDSTNFLFGHGTLTSYMTIGSGRSVVSTELQTHFNVFYGEEVKLLAKF